MSIIYLIEDSPLQGLALRRILQRIAGAEVTLFADGLAAYRAVCARAPDVLLADLILPLLHGLALCRLLKFDRRHQSIPIVVFSSTSSQNIAQQVRDAGADYFLRKPINSEDLVARVEAILAGRPIVEIPPQQPTTLRVEDWPEVEPTEHLSAGK